MKILLINFLLVPFILFGQESVFLVDSTIVQNYDGLVKTSYEYSGTSKPSFEIGQTYDSTISQWINSDKSTYLYNENNQVSLWLMEFWDSEWIGSRRLSYNYDQAENLVSIEYEKFRDNTWTFWRKDSLEYDANEFLINKYYFSWIDNSWVLNGNTFYSYDLNGNLIYEESQEESIDKYYYYYNDDNLLIEKLNIQSYDGTNDSTLYSYLYNDNKFLIREIIQFYSGSILKDTLIYNSENELIENLRAWENNQFEKDSKIVYEYDQNGNTLSAENYFWDGSNWNQGIQDDIIILTYNKGTSELRFAEFSKVELYFSEFITNLYNEKTQPSAINLFQNYPNPFNPTTTIKYVLVNRSVVQINIYDISGRKIKTLVNQNQSPGKHSVSFDALGLASGIYIYKLKAGSFEQSRKMLLVR